MVRETIRRANICQPTASTIVVATKIDAANPEKLKKLQAHAKRRKLEFHAISAVTGAGIDELKWALAKRLRPVEVSV